MILSIHISNIGRIYMQPKRRRDFGILQHGEVKTGTGQLVRFSSPPEVFEEAKIFLNNNIGSFHFPETHRTNVTHGGYGQYSRFEIKQHEYAGGDGEQGDWCYVEVLEITNTPGGRCGYIIYNNSSTKGAVFTEWKTLDDAKKAYKEFMRKQGKKMEEIYPSLSGFKRLVICGRLTPWFYAIGNQDLVGDYAFPEYMQDDPVFTFGKKFLVFEESGLPVLKICMGNRFYEPEKKPVMYAGYSNDIPPYRVVYWNDGTWWNSNERSYLRAPVPAEEGETWIAEAVEKFRHLLTGKSDRFTINFADGSKFIGITRGPNEQKPASSEGKYYLLVKLVDSDEILEGTVDFIPTLEFPNIVDFVTDKYKRNGKVAETILIDSTKTKLVKKGKRWQGVFHTRSITSVQ